MVSEEIRRDLSRNMQQRIGETFQRELNVAQHLLETVQMAELMLEAAVMMVRTSAATIAAMVPPDAQASLYDESIKGIVSQVQSGREKALEKLAATRSAIP